MLLIEVVIERLGDVGGDGNIPISDDCDNSREELGVSDSTNNDGIESIEQQRDGDDDRDESPKLLRLLPLPPKLTLLLQQLLLWLGSLKERRIDSPPSSLLRLLVRR